MKLNSHFERLLPPDQTWFSPKEVAAVIGKTDQFVRDCFLNQKILGHTANGRAGLRHEKRHRYLIHRDGVLLYLLRTANYEPDEFLAQMGELIRHRSPEEKQLLRRLLE